MFRSGIEVPREFKWHENEKTGVFSEKFELKRLTKALVFRIRLPSAYQANKVTIAPGHTPHNVIDMYRFHCSYGHSHESFLHDTANQLGHGVDRCASAMCCVFDGQGPAQGCPFHDNVSCSSKAETGVHPSRWEKGSGIDWEKSPSRDRARRSNPFHLTVLLLSVMLPRSWRSSSRLYVATGK